MRHIVILIHRRDSFDDPRYFMREMADLWREAGHGVTVLNGPGPRVEADLAILHVDATVVPQDHLDFVRQYPVVVNGRVADVSKRRISANLVHRGDEYRGPVIIKTNGNCGGHPDARLAARGPLWRRCASLVRNVVLPWSWRSCIPTGAYPILKHAGRVPPAVWHNPGLVVERFLPERADGNYCLRTWVFLGDRETNSVCYARHPVVKSHNILRREAAPEVPDELRRMRRDLGFDFGKFDYGLVDGRVVLYDANPTPAVGAFQREEFLPRVRHLAEGIRAFL